MSEKRKKVYEALLDGATEGLAGKALYDFVLERCPKATSKKIARASLLALTDPHVTDKNVLHTIYALAIAHRMDEVGAESDPHDEEDPDRENPGPPQTKEEGSRYDTLGSSRGLKRSVTNCGLRSNSFSERAC